MNILFIHQNFPGQFKHLAPALAAAGHRCVALTLRVKKPVTWARVEVLPYAVARSTGSRGHPWLIDLESKVIRGEACFRAACALRDTGFVPDIILGHPGWGETLFLRDVWPNARIGLYFELYHQSNDSTFRFGNQTNPVFLLQGDYRVAVGHSESTGTSGITARFRTPGGAGPETLTAIKPADPSQAGVWSTIP
ncbi:MAG: hypothetical protein ACO37E_04710, partial [Lutimaribacter sp.]